MLIHLQKIKVPNYHTCWCNCGLFSINMFPQQIQLRHKEFILPFNDSAHFSFNMCDFPINTHNRPFPRQFCSPWILEMMFHPIHFLFLLFIKSTYTWVRCHDPSLGFITKTRACKGAGQECNPQVTFTFLRVWKSVREWAHTISSELSLWELKFL
jgi:hypothetical protein